jgi:Xaa-Pro aminopeptidase
VVDWAARDVVKRKGEREVERDGFTHRLGESSAAIPASCAHRCGPDKTGHGIGLEGHEGPYLVGSNLAPLRPGNVFSDEPGIYIPGELGVRLEDCFVVDEKSGKGIMFTPPAENPWVL